MIDLNEIMLNKPCLVKQLKKEPSILRRFLDVGIIPCIMFVSIIIRYLATPVLISLSGSALSTVNPTPGYYRLAIIIQVFHRERIELVRHTTFCHLILFYLVEKEKEILFCLQQLGCFCYIVLIHIILNTRG